MGSRMNDPSLQRGRSCAPSCSASSTRSSRRRTSRSAPRSGSGSPPSSPTTCSATARCSGCSTTRGHRDHGQRPGRRSTSSAAASSTRTDDPVHLRGAPAPGHRPHRLPGGPADRRVLAAGRRAPGRRLPRQRDHPAAGLQRVDADHPQVLQGPVHRRRPDRLRHALAGDGRAAERLRRGPAQHHRLRRYRHREDDAAQRAVVVHPGRRADRHHRGRRRAAAPAGARRPAGVAGRPTSRARARSPSATWSATRCACGPTGSWSGECPRRRVAGHAPGDEHRPRRLAVHGARQLARATRSPGWRPWC